MALSIFLSHTLATSTTALESYDNASSGPLTLTSRDSLAEQRRLDRVRETRVPGASTTLVGY